ncbi:MAG: SPASM domain-containing protein [Chloroflexi bacterium]|nr:SPASM domain-containing protein [Chloroflexota bacterium]
MGDTYLEVEQMVNLAIELRADSIHPVPVMYRADLDAESFLPGTDGERLAVERLRELEPRATKAGVETNLHELAVFQAFGPVSHKFPCYAGWFEVAAQVDGTVTYCVRSRRAVGNVKERPLEEIWRGSEYQRLRHLYASPSARARAGDLDCNRCCIFYTNWKIARPLATLGLAPKVVARENH